eukprot:7155447-Pyramimonas_sp.AAC.1
MAGARIASFTTSFDGRSQLWQQGPSLTWTMRASLSWMKSALRAEAFRSQMEPAAAFANAGPIF